MAKTDIRTLSAEELKQTVCSRGFPAYRAKQIADWLDKGVTSFEQMTNLPEALRRELADYFELPGVIIRKRLVSSLDPTVKYVFEMADGETVESVLMEYHHGWSQCLSTQVGCRMGCAFCATGMGGLRRNLSASEMMAQIETAQADRGIRVSSIVLMGMGEPLDNFDEVLAFLDRLSQPGGVHIGMRHVSLSTCGLVDRIDELMERRLQLTLSVSLHAPNDVIRRQIMPIARKYPYEDLLKACRRYAEVTGRRISFEYALFDGINDSDECARELAGHLRGMLCHVNLIPANAVEGLPYRSSSPQRIAAFCGLLGKWGINATVRRTLGADIQASCGQLRRQVL